MTERQAGLWHIAPPGRCHSLGLTPPSDYRALTQASHILAAATADGTPGAGMGLSRGRPLSSYRYRGEMRSRFSANSRSSGERVANSRSLGEWNCNIEPIVRYSAH